MEQATKPVHKQRRLNNRDLLTVAVLSGIGGIFSTYVGYLANLLNKIFGVPFGAGQFVAGLHVFWLVLIAGLVRKPGIATIAGLLKGVVEFLSGGSHGIVIILISLLQGAAVDLFFSLRRRPGLVTYVLAGAVGAGINVIAFQILFFSGMPIPFLAVITLLAAVSGAILAGGFGWQMVSIVEQARPFIFKDSALAKTPAERGRKTGMIITAALFIVLCSGSVYYFANVYSPPWADIPGQGQVAGQVENPFEFSLSEYADKEITITAELIGDYTYVAPQPYTGIPVKHILTPAKPLPIATKLNVIATDGYSVEFDLAAVMQDERFILIQEGESLRLIAADYPGGYWVKMVYTLQVE